MTALARFLAFYAALFAAFGVASPFLPALLQQDGLQPGELGVVLAAALPSGWWRDRWADGWLTGQGGRRWCWRALRLRPHW